MRRLIVLLVFLIGTLTTLSASATQGMVLMGMDCDYQLLSMGGGIMAVVKTVNGDRPQKRDVLQGKFTPKQFDKVTNKRTGKTIKVWVDQVATSPSKALSLFSNYCR